MAPVRQDKSPQELRLSAKVAKDGKVVQRVLGIALILDGRGRSEAASLVGLDPQTLARAVQHYGAALQCRWDRWTERQDKPGAPSQADPGTKR
jgi:hypothetical protein